MALVKDLHFFLMSLPFRHISPLEVSPKVVYIESKVLWVYFMHVITRVISYLASRHHLSSCRVAHRAKDSGSRVRKWLHYLQVKGKQTAPRPHSRRLYRAQRLPFQFDYLTTLLGITSLLIDHRMT